MPPMPATTSRRKRASQSVLVATALLLSGLAWAQGDEPRDYPNRPLRILIGSTPGGDRRGARAVQGNPGCARRNGGGPRAVLHGTDRERREPRARRKTSGSRRVLQEPRRAFARRADDRRVRCAGLRAGALVRHPRA